MMRTLKDPAEVLRDFRESPLRAEYDLRFALRANCGAFLNALLNDTAFGNNDPAFRSIIAILLNSETFIHAVTTPAVTSFDQALRLTRSILEVDGNFIDTLLTALFTRQDLSDPGCVLRVLDLIDKCPDHLSNWRSLVSIHSEGDPRIKSRCAALLARHRFGDEAGLERFRRSDPRIRANIVETIGDADRETTNAVLELAIQDENNRVAGNACLALYNSGDTRSLLHLAEMLGASEPTRRITAAWVAGECRDGRFAGRLLEALRGDVPALRKRSIASLARLEPIPAAVSNNAASNNAASNNADNAAELDVCFVSAPATPVAGGFEVWLHVANLGGQPIPHLRPVDFFVWSRAQPPREGEEFLLDYTVEESAQTFAAAIRIVYPSGNEQFESALTASLAAKPAEQLWALSSYGKTPAKSAAATECRLETDAVALTALLESGPVLSADPTEAVNKVLAPESTLDQQHLVLLLDDSTLEPEPVRALCEEKNMRLHCWPLNQNAVPSASWPRFMGAIATRYTLRSSIAPVAVAVRNASVKPARFSRRIDLHMTNNLKGGTNA